MIYDYSVDTAGRPQFPFEAVPGARRLREEGGTLLSCLPDELAILLEHYTAPPAPPPPVYRHRITETDKSCVWGLDKGWLASLHAKSTHVPRCVCHQIGCTDYAYARCHHPHHSDTDATRVYLAQAHFLCLWCGNFLSRSGMVRDCALNPRALHIDKGMCVNCHKYRKRWHLSAPLSEEPSISYGCAICRKEEYTNVMDFPYPTIWDNPETLAAERLFFSGDE